MRTFSNGNRCKNRPISISCPSCNKSFLPAPEVTATISRLKANGKKLTIASKYTSAHTSPIASGLSNSSAQTPSIESN